MVFPSGLKTSTKFCCQLFQWHKNYIVLIRFEEGQRFGNASGPSYLKFQELPIPRLFRKLTFLLSASHSVKNAFRTYQHVINKFLSFGEDKLWLLQSTGFECFTNELSCTNKVLFNMYVLRGSKNMIKCRYDTGTQNLRKIIVFLSSKSRKRWLKISPRALGRL